MKEYKRGLAKPNDPKNIGPDGSAYNAQHVWLTIMVFVNPAVAALPQHAHLLAEKGCYQTTRDGPPREIVQRECREDKQESVLPDSFKPLEPTPEKHNAWLEKVKARVKPASQ